MTRGARLVIAATCVAVACGESKVASRLTERLTAPPPLLPTWRADAPDAGKRVSPEGLAMIREHEAFIGELYDDGAGNQTIGYGHLVREGEDFSDGLSQAEADSLFAKDVERVVNPSLDKIEVELTQNQIDALGSFIFNVGPGAFQKFLLPHVNAHRNERVTSRILKYVTGRDLRTGERRTLRGLVKRRRAEVALFMEELPLKFLRRKLTRAGA